jgi:hypothetical protein
MGQVKDDRKYASLNESTKYKKQALRRRKAGKTE